MRKSCRHLAGSFWIVLGVMLVLGSGCDQRSSPTTTPTQITGETGLSIDPGLGNLAGKVVGTFSKQPLAGVTVAAQAHTTTTDREGIFRLTGVGDGTLTVILSGESIYPRATVVRTAETRVAQLEAIEKESGFDLDFYRELARGNHPEERNLYPIRRWTSPVAPTFYIDTNARATLAGVISPQTIEATRAAITRALPILSGNVYATAAIQVRTFARYSFDALAENAIVISYDDSLALRGGMGLTLTDPDFAASNSGAIHKAWIFVVNQDEPYTLSGSSREALLTHELGHSFGYRHTATLPSVMQKFGGYVDLFSAADRLHMTVMYHRPVGNTDIDNDPAPTPTGKSAIRFPARQVFFDRLANVPQSPEMLQRLRTLPGLSHEFLEENAFNSPAHE